jgi:Putative mono-oxygenase ydhR
LTLPVCGDLIFTDDASRLGATTGRNIGTSSNSQSCGAEQMSINRVFLYAEIQVAVPFEKLDWRAINVTMKKEPGLKSKTWLSGINNHTIGGFYEFDSLKNARHYAEVYLPQAAKQLGGSLSVKLFDGDVTEDASRGMASPHYAKRTARVPELADS